MLKKYQLGTQPAIDMSGTTEGEVYRTPREERAVFDNVQDLGQFLEPLSTETAETTAPVISEALQKDVLKLTEAQTLDPDAYYSKYMELPQEIMLKERQDQDPVPMERFQYSSASPNIYVQNKSECIFNGMKEDRCSGGMQMQLTQLGIPNHLSHKERKELGIHGNAWTIGQNILDQGGERIFGLHDGATGIMNTYRLRKKLLANRDLDEVEMAFEEAKVGDVVEMYYPGSSSQQDAALFGRNTSTTHVGMVSMDDNGNKYVTHNIHGTWHTDPLEKVLKRSDSYFVSGIVRPSYATGTENIVPTGDLHIKKSTGSTYPIKRTPEEKAAWERKFNERKRRVAPFITGLEYYAPYVQKDMEISNNDMQDFVIPISYALYGNESAFNDPENKGFNFKRKNRDAIRAVKNIGMFTGLDNLAPGTFDPMSEGLTQIKLEQGFPASKKGKDLMKRYGIDEESIYDVSVSAAATQLLTAHNLKVLKGFFGEEKFNSLSMETKRNLLLKAHNKGVDVLIERDLKDPNVGVKAYRRMHIDSPEPYTNTGNDFALELSVNYQGILDKHEKEETVGYKVRPIKTGVEEKMDKLSNASSSMSASAYSAINSGEDLVRSTVKNVSKGARAMEEQVKEIPKPQEILGERAFAEMLRLGSLGGNPGEKLQKQLGMDVSVQDTVKAIAQDMDTFARSIDMSPKDMKEHLARQTFKDKIPTKITEIDDAAKYIPEVFTSNRDILRDFNRVMEERSVRIPMSVQQKILQDPRVLSKDITLEQAIEEYLNRNVVQSTESKIDTSIQRASAGQLASLMQDLESVPQMKKGGSLSDLPKYQNGTPETLTDKNEYERRNRAYENYSDSLKVYNDQKEIFNIAQRNNWSSGDGTGNRVPLFNPLGLPVNTYESAYDASVPLNQIVGGLQYSGRAQYGNIKPAGYLNQYDTRSGNAIKIFPFYKKPVQPVQPVIYRKPEPTMAIPKMEVEKKPEWFNQKRMIERMKEYKKPEQPKRKSTAKLYGNPNAQD